MKREQSNVMRKKLIVYINGEYFSEDRANVSAWDLGLTRGYGVFDFLRTYQGKAFHLQKHLDRLKSSADDIGLKVPLSDKETQKIIDRLMILNNLEDGNITIIVTGGKSIDHLPRTKPSILIYTSSLTEYPSECFDKGIKLMTFSLDRYLATSKTLHYIPAIIALQKAQKIGAFEALYISGKKKILEGTMSNFFALKGDVLITAEKGILKGITREVILMLAKEHFPIETRDVDFKELQEFDEAFITGSNKEIMPVVQIDDQKIGTGKIGKHTQKIMDLFKKYTESSEWI